MRKLIFTFGILLCSLTLTFTSCESAQKQDESKTVENSWDQEDRKAVTAAITDYVEGLYLVDSTRIERSVDTTLRKLGYWYNNKEKKYLDNLPMTYNKLVRLAARWNSDGDQVNEDSPKKIEIYDINSKTASAKLTAAWGIDYFHLGKVDGQWKIFNVMWQSMPKE